MLKMKKKNGFTLVELLAVIVILAVVMLIGVTVIGPIMARSQKGALGTEGIDTINAAQNAYQAEQLKGTGAKFKNNSSVCFDLEWLNFNGYFTKGSNEGYYGSVLVTYNNGTYDYSFWIGNGTYMYRGGSSNGGEKKSTYSIDHAEDYSSVTLNNCGGATNVFKCSGKVTTCATPTT